MKSVQSGQSSPLAHSIYMELLEASDRVTSLAFLNGSKNTFEEKKKKKAASIEYRIY